MNLLDTEANDLQHNRNLSNFYFAVKNVHIILEAPEAEHSIKHWTCLVVRIHGSLSFND
jgi:hypothetical protein